MGRIVFLGRGLGFFESFPFLWIWGRLWTFVGPIAWHVFCVLRVMPLIMVPDIILPIFAEEKMLTLF